METQHQRLKAPEANKEYYSKSDKHFMPLDRSLYAHRYIDRVAWVRENVHKLSSQYHLDFGCKDGYLCLTLGAEGIDCVGVDPSKDAIEEAQLKANEAKIDVLYKVGFVEDFPVGYYFDTVSVLEVLEHVVDPDLVIQTLLKHGKYIMVSTPVYEGRHGWEDAKGNDEHLRIYKKEELESLIKKYGTIISSEVRDDQICILFTAKNENN